MRHESWRRALCLGAVGLLGLAAVGTAWAGDAEDTLAVREALGLKAGELTRLVLPDRLDQTFEVVVPVDGVEMVVRLSPHSVRGENYRLIVQTPDGALEERPPSPARTVRGGVVGLPGSRAGGSLDADGLRIVIVLENDDHAWWVEPAAAAVPGLAEDLHIVFRAIDMPEPLGICGAADHHAQGLFGEPRGSQRGAANLKIAELACDTDVEYSNRFGQSVPSVENSIEGIINAVNTQYESEVGIRHEITTIIVRTGSTGSDPYATTDAGGMLGEFQNHWNATQGGVHRDMAHIFTGKELNGSTIGVAYVGVICNIGAAYGLSQATIGFGVSSCNTDLVAHEMGHNWGAGHCCPGTTMNSFLQCVNTFAQQSRTEIINHKNTRACLTSPPSPDPPGAFDLISPAPGATGVALGPLFVWSSASGAVSYRLEVGEIEGFVTGVIDVNSTSTSHLAFGGTLDEGSMYFWRVTAMNAMGSTPSTSQDQEFITTGPAPGAFGLLSPLDLEVVDSDEVAFSWDAASDAHSYEIEVDDNSDFSSPEIDESVLPSGAVEGYNAATGVLQDGVTYSWRVTAVNLIGTEASSPASLSFTVEFPATGCQGDADGNGAVDVNDITFVVSLLGSAGPIGDVDGSGSVDVNDITFIIPLLGTCMP